MALQWDDSLLLGIDEIDAQHKTIFDHFTRLSLAVESGTTPELVQELVGFLNEYAQMHFATEDRYMVKYAYPKIEDQRREHGEFARDAHEFKQRLEQDGASRELAIAVTGKLTRWIIQHIRNHDREMGMFVVERMATAG